jgi:hypothetical protein
VNVYQPSQDLVLTFSLVDAAGNGVLATAGTFRVLDADDAQLLAPTSIPNIVTEVDTVTLTVPTLQNVLNVNQRQAVRQVELSMTTPAGIHVQRELYMLQLPDVLEIGLNSFCTFAQAEAVAMGLADLAGYQASAKGDKVAALMEARDNLCRLQYRFVRNTQSQLVVDHPVIAWAADDLALSNGAEIANFPPEFLRVLRKAQVLQANYLLGASPGEHARQDGVLSKTTGESSQMFRPGMRPLDTPVCRRAMDALDGYLKQASYRIGRG